MYDNIYLKDSIDKKKDNYEIMVYQKLFRIVYFFFAYLLSI